MTDQNKPGDPPSTPMPTEADIKPGTKSDSKAEKIEDMATQPPVKQIDNMGAAIDATEKNEGKK